MGSQKLPPRDGHTNGGGVEMGIEMGGGRYGHRDGGVEMGIVFVNKQNF